MARKPVCRDDRKAVFQIRDYTASNLFERMAPLGGASPDIFLNEDAVLEKWRRPTPVYLIVEQTRGDYWKQLLTSRFHVYHQVITSGTYVVLGNQL